MSAVNIDIIVNSHCPTQLSVYFSDNYDFNCWRKRYIQIIYVDSSNVIEFWENEEIKDEIKNLNKLEERLTKIYKIFKYL